MNLLPSPRAAVWRPWRSRVGGLGVALLCCLGATTAFAAPDTKPSAPDAVMRLLEERNLIPAAAASAPATATTPAAAAAERNEPTLLTQVRDTASDLVVSAMNFIGVRYRRGGTSVEGGFDCSGFTRHIFENSIGLVLPRRAVEQAHAPGLLNIGKDDLKPGDLVFFNTVRRAFSHVGIYIGDGKFIHAPRPGGEVRVEDMRVAYWMQRFNGARRVPEASLEIPHPGP